MPRPKQKNCGRRIGSQNVISRELKEIIRQALEEEGGVEYLKKIARTEPVTFCMLLTKIIPQEVRGNMTIENHWKITPEIIETTREELKRISYKLN